MKNKIKTDTIFLGIITISQEIVDKNFIFIKVYFIYLYINISSL